MKINFNDFDMYEYDFDYRIYDKNDYSNIIVKLMDDYSDDDYYYLFLLLEKTSNKIYCFHGCENCEFNSSTVNDVIKKKKIDTLYAKDSIFIKVDNDLCLFSNYTNLDLEEELDDITNNDIININTNRIKIVDDYGNGGGFYIDFLKNKFGDNIIFYEKNMNIIH